MAKPPRPLFDARTRRRFCEALHQASAGRRVPWWVAIADVARRMEIDVDRATALADECAEAGLVQHDQSQTIKASRRATDLPHSVTLAAEGWILLSGKRRR